MQKQSSKPDSFAESDTKRGSFLNRTETIPMHLAKMARINSTEKITHMLSSSGRLDTLDAVLKCT